jgi:hypothetical protein
MCTVPVEPGTIENSFEVRFSGRGGETIEGVRVLESVHMTDVERLGNLILGPYSLPVLLHGLPRAPSLNITDGLSSKEEE